MSHNNLYACQYRERCCSAALLWMLLEATNTVHENALIPKLVITWLFSVVENIFPQKKVLSLE